MTNDHSDRMDRRVIDDLAEVLTRLGATTVFNLLGSGNFPLVHELVRAHGAQTHMARHESAVITMCDAWSQASGRVGVATLHQGPGLSNAVTSLIEASRSRTPMLVFVGEVTRGSWAANQRIDALLAAHTAEVELVRVGLASEAVSAMIRAWQVAVSTRSPVIFAVPVDVQEESAEGISDADAALIAFLAASDIAPSHPSPVALAEALELIDRSSRIVIVSGRGAVQSGARDAIEALADKTGALLATTAQALGLHTGHPANIGVSGGFASPGSRRVVHDADLIISFGAALNDWTAAHGQAIGHDAAIVQVDTDPVAFGKHRAPTVAVRADAAVVAGLLADALVERVPPRHLAGLREQIAWALDADEPVWGVIHPAHLCVALERALPVERNMAFDGGHFTWWPLRHITPSREGRTILAQSFQSIGLGLPSAAGLAIARPELPTVVFVGDGGLLLSLGEIERAAELDAPLLIVVMDDGAYGAEVHHFAPLGFAADLVTFGERDFAGVARQFGIPAVVVRSEGDLDDPLFTAWAANPRGALLVDCKIDPAVGSDQGRFVIAAGN